MKKNIFVLFALLVCGAPLFGAEAGPTGRDWLNQERAAIAAEKARIRSFIPDEGMDEDHPNYQYVQQAMDAVTAREAQANAYEQQLREYEAEVLSERLAERQRLGEMREARTQRFGQPHHGRVFSGHTSPEHQKEMRRQGPPPIAPKPRPKSPQAAPQPPRVRVGGIVQQRWGPDGLTEAERRIREQEDRDRAEAMQAAFDREQAEEAARRNAELIEQMLAAEEAERRQREEQAEQDARYAQLLSQEGQRSQASGYDPTEDEELARALEMSLSGQGSELLRLEQERLAEQKVQELLREEEYAERMRQEQAEADKAAMIEFYSAEVAAGRMTDEQFAQALANL